MTADEIRRAALGVVSDYTDNYPTTKATAFKRISVRQRELWLMASKWEPEYTGASATGVLDGNGDVDLLLMENHDTFRAENIGIVEINDKGTSDYSTGDRITVIRAGEAHAHLAPRMTLRDRMLRQVGTDLDGVTSITVHYSRLPDTIGSDGSGTIELVEPFDYLLVWDLAADLIRRTIDMDGERKAAALSVVSKAEAALLQSFQAHVQSYAPYNR